MNRLVIIGNGFDLAHGLPTGYCDFIDDYWRNVVSSVGASITIIGMMEVTLIPNLHKIFQDILKTKD